MEKASYLKLEEGEEIVFTRHRHIISLLPFAIGTVLAMLGLMFFSTFAFAHRSTLPVSAPTIALVFFILMALVVGTFLLAMFVFWQNRIILTNRHYLQIDQIGLFNRAVNKLHLDEVQDVRGVRKGFAATIFNFGEIEVETAGERENFVFKPVADPLDTAEEINECRQKFFKNAPKV